ncbi:MAG TPA: hypothetical protein VHS78_14470 [Candidatus Elarobacter sp.]|jgi:hypothetical protein|nr:hypothetical protein [Candidatus Elarobacter sp.]
MTYEELDKLSSKELHDRAFRHAERHLNVKFFWDLLEMIPAARAAEGELKESEAETLHPSMQVESAVNEDPGLMDALRPVYIDYLVQHPDA